VIILGINSAIAAFYYLRIVSFTLTAFPTRLLAAVASAAAVVVLVPFASPLMRASDAAARPATDDAALTAPTPRAGRRDQPASHDHRRRSAPVRSSRSPLAASR
jgi:hypothetical protein